MIGAYDVPANWTRSDDPDRARRIVEAAERTLAALPDGTAAEADRCRLLATVAVESRGVRSPRGPGAAVAAERIARHLDDPALLAFALNGVFMQSCTTAGLAPRRDARPAPNSVALAARHGLVNYAVLGHLIRLQARSALADFTAADEHATAVDRLAERSTNGRSWPSSPEWHRALRRAATGTPYDSAEAAYWSAAARSTARNRRDLERGLLPLALLGLQPGSAGARWRWTRARTGDRTAPGPNRSLFSPTAVDAEARTALRALPEPPPDLLYEALCAAPRPHSPSNSGDRPALERTYGRLLPASGELAGAGSGAAHLRTGRRLAHRDPPGTRPRRAADPAAGALTRRQDADRAGCPRSAPGTRRA
ncbi:regulator [Streptomyces thinghirensis]|nr:regulator [Streptomyces thinghirensis]